MQKLEVLDDFILEQPQAKSYLPIYIDVRVLIFMNIGSQTHRDRQCCHHVQRKNASLH